MFFWLRLVPVLALNAVVGYATYTAVATYVDAKQWTQTPCRTLNAQVVVSRGGKGTSIKILGAWEYRAGEHRHVTRTHDFDNGRYWRKASADARLEQLLTSQEISCFYNPKNPRQAVLDRSFKPGLWTRPIMLVVTFAVTLWVLLALRRLRHQIRGAT